MFISHWENYECVFKTTLAEFDAFFVMEKNENQSIYNFNTP